MRWCCAGFENAYRVGGERSLAVLVDQEASGPVFAIQSRTFDRGEEVAFNSPTPASLVIQARIQFCPWCGTSLRKHYGPHAARLSRPELRVE
jgi:hypothetical protein